MAAQKFDFAREGSQGAPCEVGATFSYGLTWQKESTFGSGIFTPVDLTGYTARMQVRSAPGAPLVIELNTSNGRITLGGALGTIALLIDGDSTGALVPGLYKYDLFLTDALDFETKFVYGFFEVVASVTV